MVAVDDDRPLAGGRQLADAGVQLRHRDERRTLDVHVVPFVLLPAVEQERLARLDGRVRVRRRDLDAAHVSSPSKRAITRPLRIFGTNHVDFGGMKRFCSQTAMNWSIVTGASETAIAYSPLSTRD